MATVVVLGGGTGGIVAARRLRRRLARDDRVVLVERDPVYRFAPSFLWVMTGARRPSEVVRNIDPLSRRGIELVVAEVEGIEPSERRVRTSAGTLDYDRLVVALGAELAPDLLPGLAEAAIDFYTLDGAERAGRALRGLERGRLVVLVSRLPFKCPAAPYEAALLAEALLRRRGVRGAVEIEVYTPEPFPMPTAGPEVGAALRGLVESRGICFHPERPAERLDPEARELVLVDGERIGFELLLAVPPHRAPACVRGNGLGGDTGFVPVDPATLATAAEGVHAIGDVAAVPIAGGKLLPKAGVFAHAQAEAVARRLADELAGREPGAVFDGRGSCFVEAGDGRAAYGSGDFYAPTGPRVRLHPPARRWHAGKVLFEKLWLSRLV